MITTYLNYINGEWVSSSNGEVLASTNPANPSETNGSFQRSTKEDVDKAALSAKNALKLWKKKSAIERGNYLHKAADILEQRIEDIAVTATKEMGKTVAETKGGS